jgi:hypothetical protein
LERNSINETRNKELELSKLSTPNPYGTYQSNLSSPPIINKDEREWKGKMRKLSMGYTIPTDEIFQESGKVNGLKVFLDENTFITGVVAIMKTNSIRAESRVFGSASNNEQKWECPEGE